MAQLTAGEKQLGVIFSKDYIFSIPSYQRPYSWEKEQVTELFFDLYKFYINNKDKDKKDNYFLGSIVLIKKDDAPSAQVVDGQQRLTTLTIMFSAIMRRLSNQKAKDALKACIFEEGNYLLDVHDTPRLILRAQDTEFFFEYIQNEHGKNIDNIVMQKISEPQRHIVENFRTLTELIEKTFNNDEDEMQNFCKEIIKQCYMVVVCTENQDSAFRIFTVMNSRGLELMPIDILKSQIIGSLKDTDRPNYTELWEKNEELLGRDNFNMLFSHIRMLFKKSKAKDSLLKEFTEDILKQYDGKYMAFIDDIIAKYASVYYDIINCNVTVDNGELMKSINNYLLWLSRIDNSDWVPVAMQLITRHESNAEYLNWLLKKMETLSAYLYLTAKDVNVRIERFAQILNEIDNLSCEDSLQNPLKTIELTKKEIDELIDVVKSDVYIELNAKRRNYLILRLDSFLSDKAAQYESKILTIEHVLPQHPDETSEWNELWSQEDQIQWLHKLANLVPLTKKHNSAAQNYNFKDKKDKYFVGKNGVSSYTMTTQVLTYDKWDPEIVKQLQNKYLDLIKDNWELHTNADLGEIESLVDKNRYDKETIITSNDVRARILRGKRFIAENISSDVWTIKAIVNATCTIDLTINKERQYFAGVTSVYRQLGLLIGDDYNHTANCKLSWNGKEICIDISNVE